MKKIISYFLISFLSSLLLFAQNNSPVLLSIDDNDVTLEEFLRIYKKNNKSTIDQKSLEEYLDLFINFKLKVIEAESLGMDTTSAFISELGGYQDQLAGSYISDTAYMNKQIREQYDRMTTMVRGSEIFIKCSNQAQVEDTVKAYKKAIEARNRILKGEPFAEVAIEMSEAEYVEYHKGDMGYMQGFNKSYEVENALYSMKEGEVSMPIWSKDGYRIIKLEKKMSFPGEVKVAHILLRTPGTNNISLIEAKRKQLIQIIDSLNNGSDFAEMAKKYSEDWQFGPKGGELPFLSPGQVVPSFLEACYSLKNEGDLSAPVKTVSGWHVIKLLEYKPVPSYEEMKSVIENSIKTDPSKRYARAAMMTESIGQMHGMKLYPENTEIFQSFMDSMTFKGGWDMTKAKGLDAPIITIGEKTFTQQDFNYYINTKVKPLPPLARHIYIGNLYRDFVNMVVLEYEKSTLGNRYPAFKNLIQEYHDGILLFELTDQVVWSKAVEDTAGLESFFEKNRSKYMWNERADAIIFEFDSKDLAEGSYKAISKMAKKGLEPSYVIEKSCPEDTICISVQKGLFEKKEKSLFSDIEWSTGVSEVLVKEGKFYVVVMNKIEEPTQKELYECKGLVIADYQNELETIWIKELRSKYTITVNKELLKDAK